MRQDPQQTDRLIRAALAAHEAGRFGEAERLLARALAAEPGHMAALHLRGVNLHAGGRPDAAAGMLRQAAAAGPRDAQVRRHLAHALADLGRHDEALEACREAARLAPRDAAIRNDLGVAAKAAGLEEEALAAYREAISLDPGFVHARNNLGNLLAEAGRAEEAVAAYRAALALDPGFAPAHHHLGQALLDLGRPAEAAAALRRAAELAPQDGEILSSLGGALIEAGRPAEGLAACRRAARGLPGSARVAGNHGLALMRAGRLEEAEGELRRALGLDAGLAEARINLATVCKERGALDAAEDAARDARRLSPGDADAAYVHGTVLQEAGRLGEAAEAYGEAARLDPEDPRGLWAARLMLPVLYEDEAEVGARRREWAAGIEAVHACLRLDSPRGLRRAAAAVRTMTSFHLHYQGCDNTVLQRRYGALVARIAEAAYPDLAAPVPPRAAPGRRLRVGFYSAYMHRHTVAKMFGGWMTGLDPGRFEVHLFAAGERQDAVSERLAAGVHAFTRLPRTDRAALEAIRAAGLDALVYTDIGMDPGTQLAAALRLAPVQAMAWGHPATSGLPAISHMLSSALQEPEGAQAHYAERLVRLPNLSVCVDRPEVGADSAPRRDPEAENPDVLLVCTQSIFKLLPRQDALFARICARVPGARLRFLRNRTAYANDRLARRLQRAFAAEGLDWRTRVEIVDPPDHAAFLRLNREADLALDSLWWSGGTTTLEALACGLPVVTWPGPMMRGRHTAAILAMAGLGALVARDPDDYVEIAVRLARDRAVRRALRAEVRAKAGRVFADTAPLRGLEAFLEEACGRPLGP